VTNLFWKTHKIIIELEGRFTLKYKKNNNVCTAPNNSGE